MIKVLSVIVDADVVGDVAPGLQQSLDPPALSDSGVTTQLPTTLWMSLPWISVCVLLLLSCLCFCALRKRRRRWLRKERQATFDDSTHGLTDRSSPWMDE